MAKQGGDSGNLTASFIASSDMVYDLFCEVCADFDKHLEATGFCKNCSDYLCEDCVKAHGTHRASRNHVVQTGGQMPRQKPPPPLSKSTMGSISDQCDHHPGRLTEYFCKDDGSLGCTVCMTVKHRQCRSVDHVADISEHLLDSEEYQNFTASLTSLKARSQNVITSANDNTSQAEKLCIAVAKTLQELRRKLIEAFDKMGNDIQKKTETIKLADVKKKKGIGDKGKQVLSEVEKISAELHTLQNKKQLGQLFVRMINLEGNVKALHTVLDEADADGIVTTYKFEPGSAAQDFVDKPDAIGKLSVQDPVTRPHMSITTLPASRTTSSQRVHVQQKLLEIPAAHGDTPNTAMTQPVLPSSLSPRKMEAIKVDNLKVKTNNDDDTCDITGSALIPGYNRLILADYKNSKVKLYNLQTSMVTSELTLPSKPWDVANITNDQVAVTLFDVRKVAFLKVTSALKLDREMLVGGKCTAILYYNGKLVIAFSEPLKIEIMALDGSVEKTIKRYNMFKYPSHMAINPRNDAVYVTDNDGHSVKRISLNGVEKAEYMDEQLRRPRGIVVDQQGNVLVCGESQGNIHLLNPDLKKIKLLVGGLRWPQSLSLCTDTLYVGKSGDNVSVYKLS